MSWEEYALKIRILVMSTFDSTKQLLPALLQEIVAGKIQLPDFQRGWVWDDNHVQSLLVSVARSFPVGAVMLLDTGGEVRFQTRLIENILFDNLIPEPDKLILDGQQRLTSLTQVLMLKTAVNTYDEKGKELKRFYYVDIKMALESEGIEDAFISIDEDKKQKTNFGRDVTLDLSTTELECKQLYFPCNQMLNSDDWERKLYEYAPENFPDYMAFRTKVLDAYRSYQIPIISLSKDTSKEAVCLVFEKVNTGGVSLSVFELITATYAADGYNLRDDWFGSELRQINGRLTHLKNEPILKKVESTDFLQAITLLNTYEKRQRDIASGKTGKSISAVSAKRVAVLSLTLEDYIKWADRVEKGFMLAAKFLRKECFFSNRDLPYRTQLAPLSAILTTIGERWLEPKIYQKLTRWFWCGVLGELYGGAVETRMANDVEEFLAWIENDEHEPRTVFDASFQPERLNTLRSRLSAAYKGINILILRGDAEDLFWKANVQELDQEEVAIDIHHIFPKAWCAGKDIKPAVYDSIINKTPISYKANRMIGGNAPSEYLKKLQEHKQVGLDDEGMNKLLVSHLIDPESLRRDDFYSFCDARKQSLLAMIENVMGKSAQAQSEIG